MSADLPDLVQADVKFHGSPPHLCVDARFRDRAHLDELIHALTALRDSAGDDPDHFHLQDGGPARRPGASAEVTFFRPGLASDDTTFRCLTEAQQGLLRMQQDDLVERNAVHYLTEALGRYKRMSLGDLRTMVGQVDSSRVRLDEATECVIEIQVETSQDPEGEILVEGTYRLVRGNDHSEAFYVSEEGVRVWGQAWVLEEE